MSDSVKDKFDEIAKKYDSQRRMLIPCFDDFYNISVSSLESESKKPNVLDIGAGTGILSAMVAEKYPDAKFTLIDLSSKMLDMARSRFTEKQDVKYIVADYLKYDFNDKYDMIISALSIHHLEDSEKQILYRKVFELLQPNGMFLNADQVKSGSGYVESLNKLNWKKSIEKSGLSAEEILSAYERIKLDKEATLEQQLTWLKEAGFSDVDCLYKYFHFAVLFGRRA